MAFKEYTDCVKPSDYVDMSFTAVGYLTIVTMVISGAFLAILGAVLLGGHAAIWAGIALFTSIVIYLDWWLNRRLICLGGERCLIGVVTGAGPADPIEKGGDNDFSMNVLLAPGPTNYVQDKTVYWNTLPQGHLVSERPEILAIGRGYVQDADHKRYVASLHSEFEGDGIQRMLNWAKVILAVLIAALLLPPFLAGLAFILAVILTLFGLSDVFVPAAAPGAGDPTDVDPSLGTLRRGDIVVAKGEWVYDSLHYGWNEMHPVRACLIIGKVDLPGSSLEDLFNEALPEAPWPLNLTGASLDAEIKHWCGVLDIADETVTGGSQDDPRNGWVIHPLVDGCKPPIVLT
jgi:hypothetical protein